MQQVHTGDSFAIRVQEIDNGVTKTLQLLPTGSMDVTFIEKPPSGGWDPGVTLIARRVCDGKLVQVRFDDRGRATDVEDRAEN